MSINGLMVVSIVTWSFIPSTLTPGEMHMNYLHITKPKKDHLDDPRNSTGCHFESNTNQGEKTRTSTDKRQKLPKETSVSCASNANLAAQCVTKIFQLLVVVLGVLTLKGVDCRKARILDSLEYSAISCRARSASIIDFGGVGDGETLNTKAFHEAVNHLSQYASDCGAQLFVPPGKWLMGSLNLTSHFTLYLHKDAVLFASQLFEGEMHSGFLEDLFLKLYLGLKLHSIIKNAKLYVKIPHDGLKMKEGVPEQKLRGHLGSFGITGNLPLRPMYTLSEKQSCICKDYVQKASYFAARQAVKSSSINERQTYNVGS